MNGREQNPWHGMDTAEIDRDLRGRLSEVRLVGELDLALDGDIYRSDLPIGKPSWELLATVTPR